MFTYKECLEYIKYRTPFEETVNELIYTYDSESDLVYDWIEHVFFFVVSFKLHQADLPCRYHHRRDGPSHIELNGRRWYSLNGSYIRTFNEWIELAPLPSQEKLKLRLKYGQ